MNIDASWLYEGQLTGQPVDRAIPIGLYDGLSSTSVQIFDRYQYDHDVVGRALLNGLPAYPAFSYGFNPTASMPASVNRPDANDPSSNNYQSYQPSWSAERHVLVQLCIQLADHSTTWCDGCLFLTVKVSSTIAACSR